MPCTAQAIIDWALSQVGYKEGPGNDNKYGKMYGYNKVSWCCQFIWADFYSNNASDLFYGGKKTASCTTLYNWAKKNNQTVSPSNIRQGDIGFYDWDNSGDCDHVGVCVARSGNTVYFVEGNTSSGNKGSQSNGDGVYKRERALSLVKKVWRPKYTGSASNSTTKEGYCKVDLPMLKTGDKGPAVGTMQTLLNAKGYNCGKVDKDFGTKTATALRAFQRANGLERDAICGPKSWKALLLT